MNSDHPTNVSRNKDIRRSPFFQSLWSQFAVCGCYQVENSFLVSYSVGVHQSRSIFLISSIITALWDVNHADRLCQISFLQWSFTTMATMATMATMMETMARCDVWSEENGSDFDEWMKRETTVNNTFIQTINTEIQRDDEQWHPTNQVTCSCRSISI